MIKATIVPPILPALVIWFLVLLASTTSFGANKFVRTAAQGAANGNDWNNAWSVVTLNANWGTIADGDTIWFAGGNHGLSSLSPNTSGSAGNLIYVKRATALDSVCTSAAGWNSSFDSQAIISNGSGIYYGNGNGVGSYFYFDGRTTNGFRFYGTATSFSSCGIFFGGGVNNITFTNCEIAGPGGATGYNYIGDAGGVSMRSQSGPITDVAFYDTSFHGMPSLLYTISTVNERISFTRCDFYDCVSSSSVHDNILYTGGSNKNWSWTNCVFRNWQTEGINFYQQTDHPYYFVGCLFKDPAPTGFPTCFWFANETGQATGPVFLYNNTFVNVTITSGQSRESPTTASSLASNNIYFNSSFNTANKIVASGNNLTTTAQGIFADYAGKDYRIVSTVAGGFARNAGVAISGIGTTDPYGVTRGADGAWDIGAYEYNDGTTNPPVIISSLTAAGTNGLVIAPYSIITSNTATSWTATSLPTGLNLVDSQIIGTPSAIGTFNSTITASNTAGGDSKTLVWTISSAPAAAGVFSVSPASLDFGMIATNTTSDLTFVITNSGTPGTVLTGSSTNITAPWSVVGDSSFTISNAQTKTVTVRYSPTAIAVNSGAIYWSHGISNVLSGKAYPVSSTTNWVANRSLVIYPIVSNANHIASALDESVNVGQSRAVFGWTAPNDGTIKIWATSIATNSSSDSWFIDVNATPSATDIWDMIPATDNWAVSYVHIRGSGTFNSPQFSTNSFPVVSGINRIEMVGREANARIQEMNIVFTSSDLPPSVSIVTPSSPLITNNSSVLVSGTASDGVSLTAVNVTNITVPRGFSVIGTTAWSATATNAAGTNNIVATATDSAAQTISATNTIIYDGTFPSLSITSPVNNETTANSSISVSNVVSDAIGILSVNSTNTTTAMKIDLNDSYKGIATLQVGANVIRTVAQDVAGNRTTNSVTVNYAPLGGVTNRVFTLRVSQ